MQNAPWHSMKLCQGAFFVSVAVSAAGMSTAAVFTAGVALAVVMMVVTGGALAEIQPACQQRGNGIIRRTLHTGIQFDARLGQGGLSAAANAAADQRIHLMLHQETSQRTVSAAIGAQHHAGGYRAIFHHVQLELGRVPEVLEYLSVFIGHCNTHFNFSLFNGINQPAVCIVQAGLVRLGLVPHIFIGPDQVARHVT